MTVSSTIPSASFVYTGPGDYEYTFLCYDEDHLQIYYTDTDGTESLLIMGTEADYTVALEDDFLGGTVTMILPTATDGSLRI